MQELTAAANQAIRDLAGRYGTSVDAVRTLLFAVSAGGGTMAQFYHADLGGNGQWMRGGMTMVGDMFNSGLKARVNGLCSELSSLLASQNVFAPVPQQASSANPAGPGSSAGAWWPAELGAPSSSGGQNDSQYAYFPDARRLAIRQNGRLSIYDTLDHRIGGVQQQQGDTTGSLSFSSQFGTFSVGSLPLTPPGHAPSPVQQYAPARSVPPPASPASASAASAAAGGTPQWRTPEEILAAIEQLGQLHRSGALTDAEFQAKKADLLAQL